MKRTLPALILVAWLLIPARAGAAVSLQPRLEAGSSAAYVLSMTSDSVMTMENAPPGAPESMGMQLRVDMGYDQTVESVGAEEIVLGVEYSWVSMKLELPGMFSLEYDSRRPEDAAKARDPVYAVYAGLSGGRMTMYFAPDFRLLRVEGGDEIIDSVVESMPSSDRARVRTQLQELLAGVEKQASHSFDFMPPETVTVGRTWRRGFEETIPMLGRAAIDMEYEFKGMERVNGRECAMIAMRQTVEVREFSAAVSPGMKVLSSEIAPGEGWVCFDPRNGEVAGMRSDMTMELRMGFVGAADPALERAEARMRTTVGFALTPAPR